MMRVRVMATSAVLMILLQAAIDADNATPEFQSVPPAADDTLTFGDRLPEVELHDIAGRAWRQSSFLGRVTVVNVWATSCLPCRRELPAVEELFKKGQTSEGLQVLTFSLDESAAVVRAFMAERAYSFPVIVGADQTFKVLPRKSESGVPETFIVDWNGRLSKPFRSWTFERILDEAERLYRDGRARHLILPAQPVARVVGFGE